MSASATTSTVHCTASTAPSASGNSSGSGSRNSPIANVCATVFAFPPRLAGMTPRRRITRNRSTVMPISRPRITIVTHQGTMPSIDSPTSAAPVSALSAIGSASAPNQVTRPRLRASWPSSRSVSAATTNTVNAVIRQNVSSPPSTSSAATNTGTSSRRRQVRAFAMFSSGA